MHRLLLLTKKLSWKKVDLLSNDKMGKMLSRIFQSGHVVLIENVQSANRLSIFMTLWMKKVYEDFEMKISIILI